MIRSILWWASLGLIALVSIGVQLDRQSLRTPSVAAAVPEPFRATSQYKLAAYALANENPSIALAEAEKLVRRRPLPASNLRILAQAQTLSGDVAAATTTIQYAAQRGWREPISQEAMLRLALGAGDTAEAARRYTALFLQRQTDDALLEELGPQALAEPDGPGRETLATIVGGGKRWHSHFLRRGVRVIPPDAFAEVIRRAAENGAVFDCAMLSQAAAQLGRRSEADGKVISELVEASCG